MTSDRSKVLALIASTLLVGVALFQVALALGAPWGAAAWGGAETVLSPERRVSSGIAAIVLLVAALIVCGRAGLLKRTRGWMAVFRVGIWLLVVQMALNTLANLASSSAWERFLMAPITVALCVICVLLGRSPVAAPVQGPAA